MASYGLVSSWLKALALNGTDPA